MADVAGFNEDAALAGTRFRAASPHQLHKDLFDFGSRISPLIRPRNLSPKNQSHLDGSLAIKRPQQRIENHSDGIDRESLGVRNLPLYG